MPRVAICAEVNVGDSLALVVANDMLPGFASLAVDCTAIIIFIRADAFDGVILAFVFYYRLWRGAIHLGR